MSCLPDDKYFKSLLQLPFFFCAHLEKGNCTFPQAAPSLSVEVKERKVKHFCSWCGGDWLIVVTH